MKKVILLLAFACSSFMLKAQSVEFKAFKVDLGVGFAVPTSGSGTKAGVTFTIQPHYRLSDDFALGLRLEAAGLGNENSNDGSTNVKISYLQSYLATGEYYFSKKTFRPFVGAGLGLFTQSVAVASSDGDGSGNFSNHVSRFGGYPEIGFEAGHFRLTAEYNFVGQDANYLAVKLGVFFGGGRKK